MLALIPIRASDATPVHANPPSATSSTSSINFTGIINANTNNSNPSEANLNTPNPSDANDSDTHRGLSPPRSAPSPRPGRATRPWRRLIAPWRQPWPWLSLVLLLLCSRTEPPRLWFWFALLLISLLVGLLQGLARRP